MKVLMGLGNPGAKYEKTRHNAGFWFVEAMADFLGWNRLEARSWEMRKGLECEVCEVYSGGSLAVLLAKPQTFMNASGRSAMLIARKYNLDLKHDFVLVHDDLDIEAGKFKVQVAVAPKDHKGVKNVETLLGEKNFLRVRIGVDDRGGDRTVPADEYVLEKISKQQEETIRTAIKEAVSRLRSVIEV